MSYQERRAIVSLIGSIVVSVLYTAYMVQRFPAADPYSPQVLRFWGEFFLILILVTIIGKIIIAILFAIINAITTQEAEPEMTDERDRLIDMKSSQNSGYVFIIGFVLGLFSLVLELPPSVMFIILFCSGLVSEIVSEILQFSYYRRGV